MQEGGVEIVNVHAVVGGSAGGMQALEWAIMFPAYVRPAVALACGAVQTAWQIAISEAQRQSIYRDPNWGLGFYSLDEPPSHGLSVARQNAMVWYRSPVAYEAKFGRRLQAPEPGSPGARGGSGERPSTGKTEGSEDPAGDAPGAHGEEALNITIGRPSSGIGRRSSGGEGD